MASQTEQNTTPNLAMKSDDTLRSSVLESFRSAYGVEADGVFFAPGRVNLLGAHLDYNGGDVLPVAVDLGIAGAFALRDRDTIRLRSLQADQIVEISLEDLDGKIDPARGWANYVLGTAKLLFERVGQRRGFDAVFDSNLPMAAGLSSSAAIEVVTAYALDALLGAGVPLVDLARIGHRAEREYVGVQCGIMDQFASALGREGHALWLHCTQETFEYVPLSKGALQILVVDTRKSRKLAEVAFNDRVRECAEAHAILRAKVRDLPALADYTRADLADVEADLSIEQHRRARHVITEMRRIREGVASLKAGDLASFGAQVVASHVSTAEDYEVSCDELDLVVHESCRLARVHGARLTGAGFGGCAIVLAEPDAVPEVRETVGRSFQDRFGVEPGFRVLTPGGGPRMLH